MAPRCPARPTTSCCDALLASLRFFAYPDSAPALRGAARRRHPDRRRLQLGLVAARAPAETGLAGAGRRRAGVGRGGRRPSPSARSSPRALGAGRGRARATRGTSATRPRRTSRARAPPGLRPILIARDGRRRRPARSESLRRAHTLGAAPMIEDAAPPPPEPRRGRSRSGRPFAALLAVLDDRRASRCADRRRDRGQRRHFDAEHPPIGVTLGADGPAGHGVRLRRLDHAQARAGPRARRRTSGCAGSPGRGTRRLGGRSSTSASW